MQYFPTISPPSEDMAEAVLCMIRKDAEPRTEHPHAPCSDFTWNEFYEEMLEDNVRKYYSQQERQHLMEAVLERLCSAANEPQGHVQRLEDEMGRLLVCVWRLERLTPVELADQTASILRRLLETPLELPDSGALGDLPQGYFQECHSHNNSSSSSSKAWADVKVVQLLPRNLVRYAAFFVANIGGERGFTFKAVQEVLKGVGELIHLLVRQEEEARDRQHDKTGSPQAARFVVRAFLWCFWQRARTLFQFFTLARYVRFGCRHGTGHYDWVPNFAVAPGGLSLRAFTEQAAWRIKPDEFCGWAFELLHGDATCLGLDFALLFDRFKEVWAEQPLDCSSDGVGACDGGDWRRCRRFYREVVENMNQTMHDQGCLHADGVASEPRVVWDEASYRRLADSTDGALAVDIDASEGSDKLRYCPASHRTMAISHVWSHGQGGRPHEGINTCLHNRYGSLARGMGFDSYWIDSACIPDAKELRSKAILNINPVFYSSGCVLACDRVLMNVDATPPLSTATCERIVAGVLLSDWNIRAWTMLEALKGRSHVSVLCRNNRVVSFGAALQQVADHGRVGLAAFALLLQHMMPWQDEGAILLPVMRAVAPNDIPLEVVGSWLSHRPASRPSDYLTIWSLCLSQERLRARSARVFWDQQTTVCTGFLLSDSVRMRSPPLLRAAGLSRIFRLARRNDDDDDSETAGSKVRGRTWAPATPFALPENSGGSESGGSTQPPTNAFHRPLASEATAMASVRSDGLWGPWHVSEHRVGGLAASLRAAAAAVTRRPHDLAPETARQLDDVRRRLRVHAHHIALLAPVSETVYTRFDRPDVTPSASRTGTLVAVCQSDKVASRRKMPPQERLDLCDPWEWMGVYEWPREVPLPAFAKRQMFWIA